MKRLIIALIVLACGLQVATAQRFGPEQREKLRERVEAQRVAFITQKLDLSSEEAAGFWPLYNEFKEAERDMRKGIAPDKGVDNINEEEARSLIEKAFANEHDLVDLRKQYYDRMLEVLPATKLVRLHRVEAEFNRDILERIRRRE